MAERRASSLSSDTELAHGQCGSFEQGMSAFALLDMEKIVGGHFMEHDKLHIASSRRDGTALVRQCLLPRKKKLHSGHCCFEDASQSSKISVLFMSAMKSCDSWLN